jgi:hypothetical protein
MHWREPLCRAAMDATLRTARWGARTTNSNFSMGALVMSLNWQRAVALAVLVAIGGCSKKTEEAPAPVTSDSPPAAAAAPAAAAPAQEETTAVTDEKAAAIQSALNEEAIASDPRGQWAVGATASSTYAGEKAPDAKTQYTAFSATGAPNVERYSDNGNAWAAETADKGIEWLEVTFAKPVNATQIRIRQNSAPGAIIKVELIAEGGARHTMWQGMDDTRYPPNTIGWFDRTFDKTDYKVTGARITLATNAVPGWNEIDAVQLLGD